MSVLPHLYALLLGLTFSGFTVASLNQKSDLGELSDSFAKIKFSVEQKGKSKYWQMYALEKRGVDDVLIAGLGKKHLQMVDSAIKEAGEYFREIDSSGGCREGLESSRFGLIEAWDGDKTDFMVICKGDKAMIRQFVMDKYVVNFVMVDYELADLVEMKARLDKFFSN